MSIKIYYVDTGEDATMDKLLAILDNDNPIELKGGPGSGNFGHEGRPGHEGGSSVPESNKPKSDNPHADDVPRIKLKLSKKGKRHQEDEERKAARKKRDEAIKLQNDMAEAARNRDAVGFAKASAKLPKGHPTETQAKGFTRLGDGSYVKSYNTPTGKRDMMFYESDGEWHASITTKFIGSKTKQMMESFDDWKSAYDWLNAHSR